MRSTKEKIARYVLRHDPTLDATLAKFSDMDHWEVRHIYRDAQRQRRASEIPTGDAVASDALKVLSRAGRTALEAGFFRPLQVDMRSPKIPLLSPTFEKAGETLLILPDAHYPEQDDNAIDVAVQIGQRLDVDRVVLNGDGLDVHSLASYAPAADRPLRWVEERSIAVAGLALLRSAFKDKPMSYIFGNHCVRPQKYLATTAPALQGLFTLQQLLGIDGLDFDYHEDNRISLANNQLLIRHGTYVRQEAGASVREEVRNAGMSVIMAHVHRRGLYEVYRTVNKLRGEQPLIGVEPGCLCNLSPDYLQPEKTANWQHGCAVVTLYGDSSYDVELVRIHKGRAMFRGQLFESRWRD